MDNISLIAPNSRHGVCRGCNKKIVMKKDKAIRIEAKSKSNTLFLCIDCVKYINQFMLEEIKKGVLDNNSEYDKDQYKKVGRKKVDKEPVDDSTLKIYTRKKGFYYGFTKEEKDFFKMCEKKGSAVVEEELIPDKEKGRTTGDLRLLDLKDTVCDSLFRKVRVGLGLKCHKTIFTLKDAFDVLEPEEACKLLRTQSRSVYLPLIESLALSAIATNADYVNKMIADEDLYCDDVPDMLLERAYMLDDFEVEDEQREINNRVITEFFNNIGGDDEEIERH